jgi:hypothetical protein
MNLIPNLADIALSDADRTGHLPRLFEDLISRLQLDRSYAEQSDGAAGMGEFAGKIRVLPVR